MIKSPSLKEPHKNFENPRFVHKIPIVEQKQKVVQKDLKQALGKK